MNDRPLSPHFSLFDLTKTNHSDLQEENRNVSYDEELKLAEVANLLESFRIVLGCDLQVTSGRRFLGLNKRVGSGDNSQHVKCEAADFIPSAADEVSIMGAWHRILDAKIKFGQLLVESQKHGREGYVWWIHGSLGAPYRAAERCGEAFVMRDNKRVGPMVIS